VLLVADVPVRTWVHQGAGNDRVGVRELGGAFTWHQRHMHIDFCGLRCAVNLEARVAVNFACTCDRDVTVTRDSADDATFPQLDVAHEASEQEEEGEEEEQTEKDEAGLGPEPRPAEPDDEAAVGGLPPDQPERKRPRGNQASLYSFLLMREAAVDGPRGR
jgi:hypothetical protein